VFCSSLIQSASADGPFAFKAHRARLEALKKDDGKLIKEAKDKAAADDAEAKKQEAELKIEELTKAVEAAEKKVADAKPEGKEAAEAELKTAKDKLKEATDALQPFKDTAADKAATVAALEKERDDLQTLADKQDDKDHEGKDKKSSMSQVYIQLKAASF